VLWVTRAPPHEKPHTLVGFPHEEKSMGSAVENVNFARWLVYRLQRLAISELAKCKNDGGCRCSMSVPIPDLHYPLGEKVLVVSSLSPQRVQSI
jgi:hypothetical protein